MAFPKGRKHSPEARARMAAAKQGLKHTDASREAMRLAQRKRANDRTALVVKARRLIAEIEKALADRKAASR